MGAFVAFKLDAESPDARLILRGLDQLLKAIGDLKEIIVAERAAATVSVELSDAQVNDIAAEVVRRLQDRTADE